MLSSRIEEVRAKCQALLAKAATLVGKEMPDVQIRFDLRGRCAGIAGRKGGFNPVYYVRFNVDMMTNQSWDHLINDTVPHEIAHIVCFVDGSDRGHGSAWRRMCIALGGTGQTRHSEEVVYAKGQTYVYTTSTGHRVNVSQTIHRKIQMGKVYRARGKGSLTSTCSFSLLGDMITPAPRTKEVPVQTLLPKVPVVSRTAPVAGESKAARYRARIALAMERGEDDEAIIQFGITELGMTRQLSRAYLKANRDRVK